MIVEDCAGSRHQCEKKPLSSSVCVQYAPILPLFSSSSTTSPTPTTTIKLTASQQSAFASGSLGAVELLDGNGETLDSRAFTALTYPNGVVTTYGYDERGRGTTRLGNRLTQATTGSGAGTVSYAYDTRDRLLTENGTTYGYNANGDVTSKSGEATYGWDYGACVATFPSNTKNPNSGSPGARSTSSTATAAIAPRAPTPTTAKASPRQP